MIDTNGDDDDRVTRALIGLVALQGARTHQALKPETATFKVEELVADEARLDRLVDDFQRVFVLVGGTVGRDEWIAFPSVGSFFIPLLDYPPAMAVPLTPNTFVALVERGANTDHVLHMIRTPSQISAFSMIGGGLEHKIVLPAPIATARKTAEERQDLITLLKKMRENGRKVFNLIGEMAHTAGLRAWRYDDPIGGELNHATELRPGTR